MDKLSYLHWEIPVLRSTHPLHHYQGRVITAQNIKYYRSLIEDATLESVATEQALDDFWGVAFNVCNLMCNTIRANSRQFSFHNLFEDTLTRAEVTAGRGAFEDFRLKLLGLLDVDIVETISRSADIQNWLLANKMLEQSPECWGEIQSSTLFLVNYLYGSVSSGELALSAVRRDISDYFDCRWK